MRAGIYDLPIKPSVVLYAKGSVHNLTNASRVHIARLPVITLAASYMPHQSILQRGLGCTVGSLREYSRHDVIKLMMRQPRAYQVS